MLLITRGSPAYYRSDLTWSRSAEECGSTRTTEARDGWRKGRSKVLLSSSDTMLSYPLIDLVMICYPVVTAGPLACMVAWVALCMHGLHAWYAWRRGVFFTTLRRHNECTGGRMHRRPSLSHPHTAFFSGIHNQRQSMPSLRHLLQSHSVAAAAAPQPPRAKQLQADLARARAYHLPM